MNSKGNSSINKGEPIFRCTLCPKNVTDNDNAILCNLCQTWVTSDVTILTIWTINIYKVIMSHGIISLVTIHSFNLVI